MYKYVMFLSMSALAIGCGGSDSPNPAKTDASGTDALASDAPASDAPASDAVASDATSADAASDAVAADAADVGVTCKPTAHLDPFFTIADATRCLVAEYEIGTGNASALTWGRHGGPLELDSSTPALVRWTLVDGGTSTSTKQTLTVPSVPSGAFWGSVAIDLPFFGWTALAYTTGSSPFPGELVLTDASGKLSRYFVNGFFDDVAVNATSAGRLLYTGLSPLAASAATTSAGALYAADSCGDASHPSLLPTSGSSCAAPLKVATWQKGTSGVIAVDPADNAFVVLSDPSTTSPASELRGFIASTIAPGAPATDGSSLITGAAGWNALAADGRSVFFQLFKPDYSGDDVSVADYAVDAAGKKITLSPKTAMLTNKTGATINLFTDASSRLVLAIPEPAATDGGVSTKTRLFVFGRR